MDMNELFHRHQLALMAVGQTRGASARHANFDLPGYYAERIDAYRALRGMRKYFPVTTRDDRGQTAPL